MPFIAKGPLTKYAGKLKEMESLLLAEMRRLHDPWRLWDPAGRWLDAATGCASGKIKGLTKKKAADEAGRADSMIALHSGTTLADPEMQFQRISSRNFQQFLADSKVPPRA